MIKNCNNITGSFFNVFLWYNFIYAIFIIFTDCPSPMIDPSLSEIIGTMSNSYGSEFTVSCKQGSQFSQAEHKGMTKVMMMCLASGLWNVNTSPRCERKFCLNNSSFYNHIIKFCSRCQSCISRTYCYNIRTKSWWSCLMTVTSGIVSKYRIKTSERCVRSGDTLWLVINLLEYITFEF